jgi:hypothetical protein
LPTRASNAKKGVRSRNSSVRRSREIIISEDEEEDARQGSEKESKSSSRDTGAKASGSTAAALTPTLSSRKGVLGKRPALNGACKFTSLYLIH